MSVLTPSHGSATLLVFSSFWLACSGCLGPPPAPRHLPSQQGVASETGAAAEGCEPGTDAGSPPADAGTPAQDAGTPDSGTTAQDAGSTDSGTTAQDAGTATPDAGTIPTGLVLPAARVPFARLPARNGTVVNPWSNGEPRIVKDRTPGKAGELVGFGWSNRLYAFTSRDNGDSWTFVDPTNSETIGTRDVLCAAQDSRGKIHLLFKNGPGGRVDYARVALTYSGQNVSGFSSEVKGVAVPGGYNTNIDVRATLQVVRDTLEREVLVYEVNDNINSARFRVQMGKATSLDPLSPGDFVRLDGSAGSTVVYATSSFNNHDHAAFFAQLGATKDLWLFIGPINAEYGPPDATFTTRLRLAASTNGTWSANAPISMVGSDALSSPEALSVYGTQNYVWFLYFDPVEGLSVDRVDAAGSYRHAVMPSPDPLPHRNGWGVFSVASDETRLWVIWSSLARPGASPGPRTRQAFWNGKDWTTYADPTAGDSWGMGGTLGWSEGVVATRLGESDSSLWLSTLRGGARAP